MAAAMDVSGFWQPFETVINTFDDLVKCIDVMMQKAVKHDIRFAWRGQVNSTWSLHSSLYRRLILTSGKIEDEKALAGEELRILVELHRWGLHNPSHMGRLSVLRQLAMLQHYGAPTRLIDITFNAWVGAWFAVEQKWSNGTEIFANQDSRLFAIDVTDRLINENDKYRPWEDDLSRPWKTGGASGISDKEWSTSVHVWKPSAIDARIFAQNGGFIFGGIPASSGPHGTVFQFPKGTSPSKGNWKLDEARAATCLALRPHKFKNTTGAPPSGALYNFRISHNAKKDIRDRLEKMFGYNHSTIYPDYTGFSQNATPWLKSY